MHRWRKFGVEESTYIGRLPTPNFTPSVQRVAPAGRKPQKRPRVAEIPALCAARNAAGNQLRSRIRTVVQECCKATTRVNRERQTLTPVTHKPISRSSQVHKMEEKSSGTGTALHDLHTLSSILNAINI